MINLTKWSGDDSALLKQFKEWEIQGLEEVIAIKKDGKIISVFPLSRGGQSMEYALKLSGKQDPLWLKRLIERKNFEVNYMNRQQNELFIHEFALSSGLKITDYDNNFPADHPAASYETMFQEEDFNYQQTISFELEKNQQYELCYKTMYEISFDIFESLRVDGVFYHTSGEEIFFYKDG